MAIILKQITADTFFNGYYTDGSIIVEPEIRASLQWHKEAAAAINGAEQYFEAAGTIGAIANNYFITGGGAAANDIFEADLAFLSIRGFFIKNFSEAADGTLDLTGDFCTTVLGTLVSLDVRPMGTVEWASPLGTTVGAGSDLLSLSRAGASDIPFQMFLIGSIYVEAV